MKDYKRLTERDEFGNAYIIGVDSLDYVKKNENMSDFPKFVAEEYGVGGTVSIKWDLQMSNITHTKLTSTQCRLLCQIIPI